ncbi:MAG: helix-turn-helix transcriptional regulator [Bacteroidetes bacterium]|nr:helix-turn-helix transcriptional regulator [Bacteroidota bacterium]
MEKETFLKSLGKHIVSIRESKGMTQSDLAHLCFKERQSIERVENAKTNPTAFYLYEIAQALEISVSELLDF